MKRINIIVSSVIELLTSGIPGMALFLKPHLLNENVSFFFWLLSCFEESAMVFCAK